MKKDEAMNQASQASHAAQESASAYTTQTSNYLQEAYHLFFFLILFID